MDLGSKPWERSFRNFRSHDGMDMNLGHPSFRQNTDGNVVNGNALGSAPPLPPRPDQQQYNGYNQMQYSPYTSGLYNQYRGMNIRPYGMHNNDNWFNQFLEDGPKQAFQSIEAMVRAVSSVSMMLESTYQAIFSSFQAIISVANHLSQTKAQLGQILSAIALIRYLKKFISKLFTFTGMPDDKDSIENTWNEVTAESQEYLEERDLKNRNSSWPFMVFFGVIVAVPWLLWKILKSVSPKDDSKSWMYDETRGFKGIAMYNFNASNNSEISFNLGQKLHIAPKEKQPSVRGWLLASVDGKSCGLVPANYLKISKIAPSASQTNNDAQL